VVLISCRGDRHGPPFIQKLSRRLTKRLTAWQTTVVTLLWLYISRNFAKIMGLESPEPLANLYSRSYFRATWITTALDAGFWTAMKIRRKWLRDLASMVFSIYYIFAAEQADEKVRKVRGLLTVEHLRVSWQKSTTPYLSIITKIMRPKLTRYPPRALRIPRPAESSYKDPINAWLYFDGPLSALSDHKKLILDFPGGGYVAMNPRHHDDKLLGWAGKLGIPVISLDYRKAPEYPYPYALNECYDAYHSIIATMGRCIGLAGESVPRVILTGDSAGGNFATGVVLMILQSADNTSRSWAGQQTLPVPDGLILIYPSLDMNIGNWMSDDQMALIQDKRTRKMNRNILRRKSEDYYKLTPDTPHPSDDEEDKDTSFPFPKVGKVDVGADSSQHPQTSSELSSNGPAKPPARDVAHHTALTASSKPKLLKTRLAVSSMISYFNDRILTPEMMRAMIILYIGPHIRPDFSTDFLLSPLLAPEALLAKFPKTYFLTGERDPLVDDTVIFAGRLRQAKHNQFVQRKELGLLNSKDEFQERDHVEVMLIPGISHGFLQFVSIFPEGWEYIFRCARWMEDVFEASSPSWTHSSSRSMHGPNGSTSRRHHRRMLTESSGDDEKPLEMSSSVSKESGSNSRKSSTRARGKPSRGGARVTRDMSTASFPSEDDLLGRRMKGLVGGLTGIEDGLATP
jgi:acetyl esterase/lipase